MSWRKMIYRAVKRPDGVVVCLDPNYMHQTTRIVSSERECELAYENGWFTGPQEALAGFEQAECDLGEAAAVRAYDDRRLSPSAQAEVSAIESSTIAHLAEIPEVPKPRRKKVAIQ